MSGLTQGETGMQFACAGSAEHSGNLGTARFTGGQSSSASRAKGCGTWP